jgi:phage tail-like protein
MNPVPAFNFSVLFVPTPAQLDTEQIELGAGGLATAATRTPIGFAEVSGLNAESEVEEYREGGLNFTPHKLVKWGRFPNLVFRRGVTGSNDLWNWYRQVQLGSGAPERRNGFVLLHAQGTAGATAVAGAVPIAAWFFQNALPERLNGPALNARSNELAIETLELSHEGLLRLKWSEMPGFPSSLPGLQGA